MWIFVEVEDIEVDEVIDHNYGVGSDSGHCSDHDIYKEFDY